MLASAKEPDMESFFDMDLPRSVRLFLEFLGTFAILDRDGRYVYVSESWAQKRGCDRISAIGRHVLEFFPSTRALEAMESGRPILAHPIMINDKSKEKQFTSYQPILDGDVVVGCIIQTVFRDVTEASRFSDTIAEILHERDFYRQELSRLQGAKYSISNIIGGSDSTVHLRRRVRSAARSVSNVLIEGETGTGKELVAHSIHHLSSRSPRPFVKVNCAAIPGELAEAELFGYEHGAFTGARKGGKPGKFEQAAGGSLFLDEINQLSAMIQPKLLRVLQEKEVERVGGESSIPVDARLVVAANESLEKMVEQGVFREDLYYRLNVITIRIAPLRERLDDLPELVASIMERLNDRLGTTVEGVTEEVLRRFGEYAWPGNIRELQNVLERGMNERLCGVMDWDCFVDYFRERRMRGNSGVRLGSESFRRMRRDLERSAIQRAMQETGGNKRRAAELLGISRPMLYRKLKDFEL